MKSKFVIVLMFITLTTSCKVFEGNKDLAFEIGKDITLRSVKELFDLSDAVFEKDSVLVSGSFKIAKVQKVLGVKLTEKFTARGRAEFDNLRVSTRLAWRVNEIDSTSVIISFSRFKKEPTPEFRK